MDAVTFLQTVPLFAELEPAHLEEIARHAAPFETSAGEQLFRQGDPGDGMYIIASGKVRVTTRLLGENKVALTEAERGALLGEMSIIDGRARSASARCVDATSGYFIRRAHFAMLRADRHPVALRLMRGLALVLARRQASFNEEIAAVPPPPEWSAVVRSVPPPHFETPHALETEHVNRSALESIPLFANLGHEKREELLAFTRAWVLPRGHVVFAKGHPGNSCFFTVRGAIRVTLMQGGYSETLAILGPGRLFGHMALIDGGSRSAACIVRENAIVLELDREVFHTWCDRRHPLAFDILEQMNLALVDGLRDSGKLMARFAVEGRIKQRVSTITVPANLQKLVPTL